MKTCKKCGHLCHCMEDEHLGCKCEECRCSHGQSEGVIIDDSDECESCQ